MINCLYYTVRYFVEFSNIEANAMISRYVCCAVKDRRVKEGSFQGVGKENSLNHRKYDLLFCLSVKM